MHIFNALTPPPPSLICQKSFHPVNARSKFYSRLYPTRSYFKTKFLCLVSRLRRDKNDKKLPILPFSCPFSPANTTHAKASCLCLGLQVFSFVGVFLFLRNYIARMLTIKHGKSSLYIFLFIMNLKNVWFC